MNSVVKKILIPFDMIFDRTASAAGAVLFIQIPLFISHYAQRLGGHVDELTRVVGQYRSAAAENGKALEEYVSKFLNSSEADFVSAGKIMKLNIDRLADLKESLRHLTDSGPFSRLIYFIRDIDLDIAAASAKNYSFGLVFTPEGMIYALCGVIAGSLLFFGIKKLMSLLINRIFRNGSNQ